MLLVDVGIVQDWDWFDNPRKSQFRCEKNSVIAKYRQQAGLTQEQLAEKLGVSNETVSRIERGVILPSLVRLSDIADHLNCRTEELFADKTFAKQDRHSHLARLLDELDHNDREWLVAMVEQMVEKLREDKG